MGQSGTRGTTTSLVEDLANWFGQCHVPVLKKRPGCAFAGLGWLANLVLLTNLSGQCFTKFIGESLVEEKRKKRYALARPGMFPWMSMSMLGEA